MELKILLAVLSIVSALITGLLIPYIKSKIDREKRVEIMEMVEVAVKAAEQIYDVKYPDGNKGAEKKEYVVSWLNERGVKIDGEALDVLIEATVKELNLWQKEIVNA